jgi:hypothetical protein
MPEPIRPQGHEFDAGFLVSGARRAKTRGSEAIAKRRNGVR